MSTLMCRFQKKRNRIDVEAALEKIEIRKGRWLRVIFKDTDSPRIPVLPSSANSSKTVVNSWMNRDNQNERVSAEDQTHRSNKIVMFFLHGVGGCADVWHKQIEYFSKLGYAVVAPDFLGHGGSSAPRDPSSYDFSELSHDMFAVFDRYRSEKKNILVGHSYGMGFHAHSLQDTLQFYDAFKAPSYVLRATMMGQNWNEGDEQFHSELMVATLLIYGSHDKFVSLEEETYMNETIYGSTLEVLDDAGHMVMLECPDKVNELIVEFLRRDACTQSECLSQGNNQPSCSNAPTDLKSLSSTLYNSEVMLNRSSNF